MIKFFLALAIFLTCAVCGFTKSSRLRCRMRYLGELKSALKIIQSSIRFTYTDISKAFYEADRLCNTYGVFALAARNIKQMGASRAWKYAINRCGPSMCLSEEDIRTLSLLSSNLGMTDECEQTKTIEGVMNMLDIHIDSARFDVEKYCRLYSSGGILTGAFLCLMLV